MVSDQLEAHFDRLQEALEGLCDPKAKAAQEVHRLRAQGHAALDCMFDLVCEVNSIPKGVTA